MKSAGAYTAKRLVRGRGPRATAEMARTYYCVECLRQSTGFNYFNYIIREPAPGGSTDAVRPNQP